MTLKVENRIPEMIGVLTRVNSPQNRRDAMREPARKGFEHVMHSLKAWAPVGKVEPGWATPHGVVNHGRPSLRQHGTTLEHGWKRRIENFGPGIAFIIENWAPHIMHVIYGTSPHEIPGPVAFFWSDYSSTGDAGWGPYQGDLPGPFYFSRVMHPGARGNMFVTPAVRASQPRLRGLTREGAAIAMRPLNQFFGKS